MKYGADVPKILQFQAGEFRQQSVAIFVLGYNHEGQHKERKLRIRVGDGMIAGLVDEHKIVTAFLCHNGKLYYEDLVMSKGIKDNARKNKSI